MPDPRCDLPSLGAGPGCTDPMLAPERECTYPTHHRRVVAVWPGLPGTLTFTSQPRACYLLPWVLVMESGLHAASQRWGGGTQHLPSLLLSIALFHQPEEVSGAGPVPQSQQTLAGTHSPDQVCTRDRPANCWTKLWRGSLHAPPLGPRHIVIEQGHTRFTQPRATVTASQAPKGLVEFAQNGADLGFMTFPVLSPIWC